MIRSILTLLKNQFGQNVLPGLFICFVSVLLFYVVDFTVTYSRLYNIPNGASAENTYAFHIDRLGNNALTGDSLIESYDRLIQQISQLPGVTDHTVCGYAYPYTNWMWNGDLHLDSLHQADAVFNRFVDYNYASMFGLKLISGRWFTPEEVANKAYVGIVSENVVEDFKRAGDIGQVIGRFTKPHINETDSFQIIGVVAGIKDNDFEKPLRAYYIPLGHFLGNDRNSPRIPQLVIRVPKANEAEFAPALDNFIVHYLKDSGFNISYFSPIAKIREDNNSRVGKDLSLYAMGASFFLINILLAIFGTFTFRMKRRIGEMGVRIALGSTKWGLFRFVISEALILTSICLLIALVICINIAYADLLVPALPVTVLRVVGSFAITATIILLAIFVSVYIPARRAATIAPAEALHYE